MKERTRTIDIKFFELCDEIDYWKEEAYKYKKLYENSQKERWKEIEEARDHSNQMNSIMISALLNMEEDQIERAYGESNCPDECI